MGGGASPSRERKDERERERGGEEPEEMLQKSWELLLDVPSFSPVAQAEPVGRRMVSRAKYTSVGIFRGFL